MNALRYATILFLGIGIGVTGGKFLVSPEGERAGGGEALSCSDCQSKYDELKTKLEQISSVDIEEYLQLKTMREKYEKADEIFGKILNIFLLDLGIRVSGKQLDALKTSTIPTRNSGGELAPDVKVKLSDAQPEKAAVEAKTENARKSAADVRDRPHANNVNSPDEVDAFLAKTALEDARSEWRSSRDVRIEPVARQINGIFTGQISFFDKVKKPWDIDMDTDGRIDGGKFVGKAMIKVASRDEDMSSTSRAGEGSELQNYKLAADGAILINTNGGDGLIQLYYFARVRMFSGNFYKKTGMDDFKHVGTVSLTKR